MNLLMVLFSLLTISIIVSGSLLKFFENKLPTCFIKIIRYGKFAHKGKISGLTDRLIIEVPKYWFRHFYVFGTLVYLFVFYHATATFIFNSELPNWLHDLLNVSCGTNRKAHIPAIKVYIALALMCMQVCRRFYDTHFVSVYSKNVKINLAQYIIGLVYYPGTALAIICEAPKFTIPAANISSTLKWPDLSHFDFVACIIFIWAWWHQHTTTKILADLRKDKRGNIVSDAHQLPKGDWFNVLSSPHQTAEILMYFSLTVLLWYNMTWFFVFTWVLANQVLTILLSHWWYQSAFDNFPKTRKALIPFVY